MRLLLHPHRPSYLRMQKPINTQPEIYRNLSAVVEFVCPCIRKTKAGKEEVFRTSFCTHS